EPSLLNITRTWARNSMLGDLREMRTRSDHIELRVWGGYGLAQTQGVVLRRADGHWSAFLASVVRCEALIPKSVADTSSAATVRQYLAEARRHCGTSVDSVASGARIVTTDTLVVTPLDIPESDIEAQWKAALDAGLLRLPPRVKRRQVILDAFTYVVEL